MRREGERRIVSLEDWASERASSLPVMSKQERDELVAAALRGPMPDLAAIAGQNDIAAQQRRAAIAAAWRADS